MAHVFRCYTEKRDGFDVEAKALLKDLTGTLGVTNLTGVRLFNRYDAEGIDEATYRAARSGVFSEPQCDLCYDSVLPAWSPLRNHHCVPSPPCVTTRRSP